MINTATLCMVVTFCAVLVSGSKPGKSGDMVRVRDTIGFTVPDFLAFKDHGFLAPFSRLDTTYHFEFYDDRDTLILDPADIDEVGYISLLRVFVDSQHTYWDKNGKLQLLPVSQIVLRYDRVDSDEWMCIDYTRNKYYHIKEDMNTITGYDPFDIASVYKGTDSEMVALFRFCRTKEEE